MHEICRTVLDRFSDQKLKTKLFREAKVVAAACFNIQQRDLSNKMDKIMFTYGSPEGRF